MGVNFRWLINASLLALPVGVTVGVLIGVDSHRHATGQAPIFTQPVGGPGTDGSVGGGNGNKNDNRVKIDLRCGLQDATTPPSAGVKYQMNPNQWGFTADTRGAMCMNVTSFNNGTYSSPSAAPPFTVTWAYAPGPATAPVHAFPNVQVITDLPMPLSNAKSINIGTRWTYGVGNTPVEKTDEAAMTANAANTNVAIDMFLDPNSKTAENSSLAAFEVMVWLGRFGTAAEVIGEKNGIIATESINGTTFNLYTGQNSLKQNVLTWLAFGGIQETFYGDIRALIDKLDTVPQAKFTSSSLYLGHLGMGSEAFSATNNVTLSMPYLSVDIGN
ncbi:hypothetical protein VTL71DRAFT_51 [Oculimacula yallundae]|uniref:Uncharacterized protein n=1 Tax=Oculimacula yallundae TaxID=86028 RepID=A0ABR4D192_9HELO